MGRISPKWIELVLIVVGAIAGAAVVNFLIAPSTGISKTMTMILAAACGGACSQLLLILARKR